MSGDDRQHPRFLPTNNPDEAHLVGIYFETPQQLEEHRARMRHLLETHKVMSAAKGDGHLLLCFITVPEERAKIVAQIENGLPESARRSVSYSTKPPRRHSTPPQHESTIPPTDPLPHVSGFAPKLTDPPVTYSYDEPDDDTRKTSSYIPDRPSSIPPAY